MFSCPQQDVQLPLLSLLQLSITIILSESVAERFQNWKLWLLC